MRPWPTMVSKVTWWSYIIDFILFEFLDPENHILDILITSVSLIHPEIMLINHLGHATSTNYSFQGHVMVRHYWFYLIWIPWPGKPYSGHWDHLSIIYRPWDNRVGGHLGRHLELWTLATGERHSPPIFRKHMPMPRKWDQSHLLIIKTATGDSFWTSGPGLIPQACLKAHNWVGWWVCTLAFHVFTSWHVLNVML